MGFDIDPLAVMLAKVNWVMAMRDLFSVHDGNIAIPIYHADSLFVATPITHRMPENAGDSYVLHFDNHQVALPGFLLSPEHRSTFDAFMAKAYRFAMIRANHPEVVLTDDEVSIVVDSITQETEIGSFPGPEYKPIDIIPSTYVSEHIIINETTLNCIHNLTNVDFYLYPYDLLSDCKMSGAFSYFITTS